MKERKAFLMRIDPALWAELEAWAQEELRSVNGQVEMILKQAVMKRKGSAKKASVAEGGRSRLTLERTPAANLPLRNIHLLAASSLVTDPILEVTGAVALGGLAA